MTDNRLTQGLDNRSAGVDLLARAEALVRAPSIPSHLSAELERALMLVREGDPLGLRTLMAAVKGADDFRHIVHADGNLHFSMHVRGLLDSASWALESTSIRADVAERIRSAIRLIQRGEETGVGALEAALTESG